MIRASSRQIQTPEEEELERKLAELALLESEMIKSELELTTVQAELQAFELRYLRTVGIKIAKLDEIKAGIAEAFSRMHSSDNIANEEASRAREQARESARATGTDPTRSDAEVNAAYKAGNENQLHDLLQEWDGSPEKVTGDDIGANLIRVIRKIVQVKKRLDGIKSEMGSLVQSAIFQLWSKVQGVESDHRDLLSEMATQLEEEIIEQQKRLDKLIDIFTHAQTQKNV